MNRSKLGVIDALGLGFELVARAAWIMLIPVALDLFFWLGPRLSVRKPLEGLTALLSAQLAAAPNASPMKPEELRAALSEFGNTFNLFSLLATDLNGSHFLPVPTVKAFDPATPNPPLILLENAWQVLAAAAVLLPLGVLVGAMYMTLIDDRLAGRAGRAPLAKRMLGAWFAYLRLGLAIGLLLLACGVPFGMLAGVAALIQPVLGVILLMAGWMATIWIGLYIWFAIYAIAGGSGVVRAVAASAGVVQRNFSTVIWLILISFLLTAGTTIVASWLEVSWLGTLLAIAANAFIGSGLAAAAFVFFRDRQEHLAASRQPSGGVRAEMRDP